MTRKLKHCPKCNQKVEPVKKTEFDKLLKSCFDAPPLRLKDLKEQLKSRGSDFVKLKGTHYLEYHDSVYQRRNFGLESRILKFRVPPTANFAD